MLDVAIYSLKRSWLVHHVHPDFSSQFRRPKELPKDKAAAASPGEPFRSGLMEPESGVVFDLQKYLDFEWILYDFVGITGQKRNLKISQDRDLT